MDILIMVLFVLAVVISLIPTTEEKREEHNNYRKLFHCYGKHDWVVKKVDEVEANYTVCKNCKFLAGTDDQYEES